MDKDGLLHKYQDENDDLKKKLDEEIKFSQWLKYFSGYIYSCLLYTSPSPRDLSTSRMPSSA